MAREYDHLFKLLIIGDSGKSARLFTRTNHPSSSRPSLCPRQEWGRAVCCSGSQTTCSQVSRLGRLTAHPAPDRSGQPNPSHLSIWFTPPHAVYTVWCLARLDCSGVMRCTRALQFMLAREEHVLVLVRALLATTCMQWTQGTLPIPPLSHTEHPPGVRTCTWLQERRLR